MLRAARRTIVVGIGNPDRGDDGAGRRVARRLRGTLPPPVEVAEADGEATSLLALLERAETAILIDACVSQAAPGTIRRFDVTGGPLPKARFGVSTHGLGLAEAIELARALGRLPQSCIVYAIEADSVADGGALSPAVATAVEAVESAIRTEIEQAGAVDHA